jgi:hypothetical protein
VFWIRFVAGEISIVIGVEPQFQSAVLYVALDNDNIQPIRAEWNYADDTVNLLQMSYIVKRVFTDQFLDGLTGRITIQVPLFNQRDAAPTSFGANPRMRILYDGPARLGYFEIRGQ